MRLGYKEGHYDQLNRCVNSTDYGLSEYTHLEVVCADEIALQAQTGHFLHTARIGPARLLHRIFLDVKTGLTMLQFLEEGMFVLETLYGRALPTIFPEEELPTVSQGEIAAQELEGTLKNAHDEWDKPGAIRAKVYRACFPTIRLITDAPADYNSNTHVMCSYGGFTGRSNS